MEAMVAPFNKTSFCSDEVRSWFDNIINTIKVDQLKLETGLASKQEQHFYDTMIQGNGLEILSNLRTETIKHFIVSILSDFIKELNPCIDRISKLAFSYNAASVLCWAVIPDNAEDVEDALIIAKAKVDAKYAHDGFYVSLTILEKSDYLTVPKHYQSIIQ